MASFLERFLKKTRPEEITFQDFEAFLEQSIEEHQNLEYKSGNLLVDRNGSLIKPQKRWDVIGSLALAKTVAGFANAEGGLLVLGVEELEEKHNGVVIRRRPGSIAPLPINVTKENIENQLRAKIQFPIDGITIAPVYPDETRVIYLIDVPQSIRGPHRVDELFYYQRYNFSTLEMQHFQIADLFGKRFAPDLDVELERGSGSPDVFSLHPVIYNRGRAVAKYMMVSFTMDHNTYTIAYAAQTWGIHEGVWEYHAGVNVVVYPDRPFRADFLTFKLSAANAQVQPITFHFELYAEDMQGKKKTLTFDPRNYVP